MLRLLDRRAPLFQLLDLLVLPHTVITSALYTLALLLLHVAYSRATRITFVVLACCAAAAQLANAALFALQEWRGPFLTPLLRARRNQRHVRQLPVLLDLFACSLVAFAFLTQSLWALDTSAAHEHYYHFEPSDDATDSAFRMAVSFLTQSAFSATGLGINPLKPSHVISTGMFGVYGVYTVLMKAALFVLLVHELFGERHRKLFEEGWAALEHGDQIAIPLVQTPGEKPIVASMPAFVLSEHNELQHAFVPVSQQQQQQ